MSGQHEEKQRVTLIMVLAVILIALVLSLLAYWSTLSVPFILDDLTYVAAVHPEGPLDWEQVPKVLWPSEEPYQYNHHFRPVGWLSLLVDDHFLGCEPHRFRTVAILLHGLCGALVGILAMRCGIGLLGGLAASAFFVWTPAAFEPVIWVCHRFTLLASLFWLVAAHGGMTFAKRGRGLWLLIAGAALAVFSKDSMLSLLWALVPMVLVWSTKGHRLRRTFAVGASLALMVALNVTLRRLCTGAWLPQVDTGHSILDSLERGDLWEDAKVFLSNVFVPIAKDVKGQAVSPEVWVWWWWIAWVAIAAVVLVSWRKSWRSAAALLIGILAVLLLLVPVMSLGGHLAGARRLYLPIALLAAWLPVAVGRRYLAVLLLMAVPIVCGLIAHQSIYRGVATKIHRIESAVESIQPEEATVYVHGLPAHDNGTPIFGRRPSQFVRRFMPPLKEQKRNIVSDPDAVREKLQTGLGADVLLDVRVSGSDQAMWSVVEHREPPPDQKLRVVWPQRGKAWPGPKGDIAVIFELKPAPGNAEISSRTLEEILDDGLLRLSLDCLADDQPASVWLIRGDQVQLSALAGGLVRARIPMVGLGGLYPVMGLPRLIEIAHGSFGPGELKITLLSPGSEGESLSGSAEVKFRLRAR